jgi:hypothetical protein
LEFIAAAKRGILARTKQAHPQSRDRLSTARQRENDAVTLEPALDDAAMQPIQIFGWGLAPIRLEDQWQLRGN